jgi:hypothetical protein
MHPFDGFFPEVKKRAKDPGDESGAFALKIDFVSKG